LATGSGSRPSVRAGERLRLDGLSVTTRTVNDAALAARAAALGVDAITTDRPAALHHQLAAMSLEA